MRKCTIVVAVMLVAMTVSVSAEAIFVENPSFELPGVDKPNIADIPGWDGADDSLFAGAEVDWGPTDGVYTGYMQTGAGIYNLTDHTIAGGTEYTLTFDIRRTWWGDTTTVDLYYDDNGNRVPIGSVEVTFADMATTDMEERTVMVNSDDVPASIGKELGIQITCGTLNVYEDGWVGYDNFRLDGVSLIVSLIHPAPSGVSLVDIDDDLEWAVVNDWNVDLYFQADDPNFTDVAPVRTDTSDTTYEPGTMVNETTYYWRVDAYEPNGLDFIVHTGPVWEFTTAPATPTITLHPISQTVAAGSEVVLAIDGTNIDPARAQWYQDNVELTGKTGLTLTISDVQLGEEGYYHCVASNTAGDDVSESARLLTERLMAQWGFEGNINDSVASLGGVYLDPEPANPNPAETYSTDSIEGGQSFSFDPNSFYIEVDNAEYFNYVTEGYSVSAWIKVTETPNGWDSYIMKTGAYWLNALSDSYVMVLGNWSLDPVLEDGGWHCTVATYDPTDRTVRYYVDGKFNLEFTNTPGKTDEPLIFGASDATGRGRYNGLLDDVKMYSYALDDVAVALLYTDFNPGSEVCLGYPNFDSTGPEGTPDCRINVYELAEWAAAWMECNLVPTCIP